MVPKQDSIQKISKFIMEDVIHMRALVYRGNGELALEDRPVPVLQDERDAIVEVTLTTICSSDIHIRRGAVPRAVPGTILGHEFVGRVVQTGNAVRKVKPGDRVAVNVETFSPPGSGRPKSGKFPRRIRWR